MFTGLIEEVGRVLWIRASERGTVLQISAPALAPEARVGDSISVNGCCLTVKSRRGEHLSFDLLEETLARTNLRDLRPASAVNLERALSAQSLLGGHFVQGHIDCAARVFAYDGGRTEQRLEVELPGEFARYVVPKGSIAVNGISLTIAELKEDRIVLCIIPHTHERTNLAELAAGARVNLEFDLLAKYVERMVAHFAPHG